MKPFRFRAKGMTKFGKRHVPGVMNKTEEEYSQLLEARKLAGEILTWEFEAVTFKLGKDLRFTPDFAIFKADGSMEFVDTKGGLIDDKSIVKAKVAAEKFPQFLFVQEQKQAKKNGGHWKRTEY